MGSCHGQMGVPVELQAMPEAWGEGRGKGKASKCLERQSASPNVDRRTPIQTRDVKIEQIREDELPEEDGNGKPDEHKKHQRDIFEGIVFNKPVGRSLSCRGKRDSPVSDESISWYDLVDVMERGSQWKPPANVAHAVKMGCKETRGKLLTYSEYMFKELLKKVALLNANTRMRIRRDVKQETAVAGAQITKLAEDLKELKGFVEEHNKSQNALLQQQQLKQQQQQQQQLKQQQQQQQQQGQKKKTSTKQSIKNLPSEIRAASIKSTHPIGQSASITQGGHTPIKSRPSKIPVRKAASAMCDDRVASVAMPVMLAPKLRERLAQHQPMKKVVDAADDVGASNKAKKKKMKKKVKECSKRQEKAKRDNSRSTWTSHF